jgi:hypothetical protein
VRVTGKALPIGTIEPFVANNRPNGDPCQTSSAGVLAPTTLPTGPGDHIAVANAQTFDDESLNGLSRATADARVVDLQLGGTLVQAQVLTSHAEGNDPDGLCGPEQPTFSGNAHVVNLTVAGTNIPVDPAKNTDISLGPLGTLHLNQETIAADGGVTERALFLETPLADVVVSESQVGPSAGMQDAIDRNCNPETPCPDPNTGQTSTTETDPFVDPTAPETQGQHPDCVPEFSEPQGNGDNDAHDFVHFVRSINDTETSPNGSFVPDNPADDDDPMTPEVEETATRNRFNGKAGFFEDGDTTPSIEGDIYDDEDMNFRLSPLTIDAYFAPSDLAASPWRRFCGTGVIMPLDEDGDGLMDDGTPVAPFETGQIRKFLIETFDKKWLDPDAPGGDQSDYWVIDIYAPGSDFDTQQCDPAPGDPNTNPPTAGGRDHDSPENPNRATLDYHSEGQTIAGNIEIHSERVEDADNDDTTPM